MSTEYAEPVYAPTWPSISALIAALISVVLVVVDVIADSRTSFISAVAGYLFGAILANILVQLHRRGRNRASSSVWYNPVPRLDLMSKAALAIGLASGFYHAFVVATELAK